MLYSPVGSDSYRMAATKDVVSDYVNCKLFFVNIKGRVGVCPTINYFYVILLAAWGCAAGTRRREMGRLEKIRLTAAGKNHKFA
jgi:hypothetical protein